MPGTDPRALSLDPPSLAEMMTADYSDGLIILAGTENPFGGYVVAIDVDHGPEVWPSMPKGFLYDELGTQDTKRHVFIRTTDRLEGVLNLVVYGTGELVAEVKGLNLSLRSWPTIPPGKPRGYKPMSWPIDPLSDPPVGTARQLAEELANGLSKVLGESIWVKDSESRQVWTGTNGSVPQTLSEHVEAELERRGCRLKSPGPTGWQTGFCPFHENKKSPAFRVNLQQGWICNSTCGKGSIYGLARRLGIHISNSRPGRRRQTHPSHPKPVNVSWEVRV